jgi:ribosomal protein S18 acetylase RimI-like enzyme
VIELRLLTQEDVGSLEPWFDDAETRRRLGGRDWPHQVLSLAEPPSRVALVARERGVAVALADVEHCERSSVALVVAPAVRGRGVGRRVLEALLEGDLAGRTVVVGVEPDNAPAVRLVERTGFVRVGTDADGFDEYVRG